MFNASNVRIQRKLRWFKLEKCIKLFTSTFFKKALIQLDVYSCKDFRKTDVLECLEEFEPIIVEYKYFDRETSFRS